MDINSLLSIVKDQFIEDNLDLFTTSTNFKSLKSFDSLTAMAIITAVEDEYNITISSNHFKGITTVDELFKYILDKSLNHE